jgi:large subunit ribosomal protein L25
MDQITLEAQSRIALGKKNGALRRSGITPIHVYGRGVDSQSLQADTHDLINTLNQVGFTTPLTVQVAGEEHFVLVQHVQRHPVTEHLMHVDLMAVSRTERRQASVPLHFVGEAPAAREEGAQIFEDLHTLEVEALPTDVPAEFIIDLEILVGADSVIHARDVTLPDGVTLVTDPEAPIVRIVFRRGVEEGEAPILGEGEEAAQGAAAPAVADKPAAEESGKDA